MDGPRRGCGATSRRQLLASTGSLAGVGWAGCLGSSTDSVAVLSAGSLARTFEEYVGPAFEDETGIVVQGEYFGTNAVIRMIEDRTKFPDVVVSADATLLRDRLYGEFTDWDVAFAANSLGLSYTPDTEFGRRLADGQPWYDLALQTGPGEIAIADPDLDPLGYRAIQAFELAAAEHGLDGFRETLVDRVYQEPDEPQLLAGVETGSRAAAVVYRNMAQDHDLPFFEFPDAYNFSDPALADQYGTVSYTTDEEAYTAEGRPILYNTTVNSAADNPEAGRKLVEFLVDNPDRLTDAGLTVGPNLPRSSGAVPAQITI